MRYVHIDTVEPGQSLGRTIFSGNGTPLLSNGVQLTVYMINTLRRIGATMLYIKDPNFEDIEINDMVSEETKRILIKKMEETFETIRSGKELDARGIGISIDFLLQDVMRNKELLVQLSDIRTEDNAYYVHAINVAMMSVLTGIQLQLNHSQLKDLAIGALLHDVGKVGMKGQDDVSDPKKHHTWRGFELIKNNREFSLLAAHVAFQHHETPDGLGIPRGLEQDQLHQYAKIVAAANQYDNLLYNPLTGETLLPHEACEKLMALSGTKVDYETLISFLRIVSVYPTGISVQLSTGETGVVVGQHRGLPGRPIVRVLLREGNDEDDNINNEIIVKEIDLAKHTTVFIEAVLS